MSKILFEGNWVTADGDPDNTSDIPQWAQEWNAVRAILGDYLQPDSTLSLDDAVAQVAPFYKKQPTSYTTVLILPVHLSKQIPYDHPSSKKLAEFMRALHDSGKWISEDKIDERERQREQASFWSDFLGCLADENWPPEAHLGDNDDPMWYANDCAFTANVVYPTYRSEQFDHFGVYEALTRATDVASTAPVEVRDAYVIGAAQFVFVHATAIYDEVIRERERNKYPRVISENARGCFSSLTRPEYEPPPPTPDVWLTWNDWQAWRQMFRHIAVDETHGTKCRDIAQKAAELMALQEKDKEVRG